MAAQGLAHYISALSISLFMSAFLITYFLFSMYGVSWSSGINLPDTIKIYSGEQNLKAGTFNISAFYTDGGGTWTQVTDIGLVLNTVNSPYGAGILIKNIQIGDDYKITNHYQINNSVKGDYFVYVRRTGGHDTIAIKVTSDGFHIPTYSMLGLPSYDEVFIPYPNANQITNAVITTTFYERISGNPILSFSFNGNTYLTSDNLIRNMNLLGLFGIYYGGVSSNTPEFTLEYFDSDNTIIQSGSDMFSSNPILAPFQTAYAFIKTMLVLTFWNVPEQYLPAMLNVILIKTQAFALLVCLVVLARGGGN